MDTNTVLLIAIPVLVVAAGLLVIGAARRKDRDSAFGEVSSETRRKDRGAYKPAADDEEVAASGKEVELAARQEYRAEVDRQPPEPPAEFVEPSEERVGMNRRHFFNVGAVTLMGVSSGAFGAAIIGFLWPSSVAGFGAQIRLGRSADLDQAIDEGDGFAYFPEGRLWLTRYPAGGISAAENIYSEQELTGMREGFVALYQECPHLGCRVPECTSSQWFECPCHGSQYNRVGEHKGGPAPRGMDRFPASIQGGDLVVDTGEVLLGPPLGTNTTGQEAEGPHCV